MILIFCTFSCQKVTRPTLIKSLFNCNITSKLNKASHHLITFLESFILFHLALVNFCESQLLLKSKNKTLEFHRFIFNQFFLSNFLALCIAFCYFSDPHRPKWDRTVLLYEQIDLISDQSLSAVAAISFSCLVGFWLSWSKEQQPIHFI